MIQRAATRKMLIVSVALGVCLVLLGIYVARSASLRPDASEPLTLSELVASYAPEAYGLPDYIGGYRVLAVFSDKNWPCFRDDGLGVTFANAGTVSMEELAAQLPRYGIGQNMIVFAPADTSPINERLELARIYLASKDMVCYNNLGGASPLEMIPPPTTSSLR